MERKIDPRFIDGQWRYYPMYRRSRGARWQHYTDPRNKNDSLWFATAGASQLYIEHGYIRAAVQSGLRNEGRTQRG
jgi:hypothetical protein